MGVLSGYATRLTIAQRTLYDRLRSQGIEDAVARQLAVAIEKSVPLKKRKRTTSEAYARAYAAEAKKFLDPLYSRHVHSQAMARAGGLVSGQNRRAARDQAIADAMALAQGEPLAKGNKPMGAAFSHARASGEDQSHEARKKRANRYLRSKGHKSIGKALEAAITLSKGGPGSGRYPAGSHDNEPAEQTNRLEPTGHTSSGKPIYGAAYAKSDWYEDFTPQDHKDAAKILGKANDKDSQKEHLAVAREKERGQQIDKTSSGKAVYEKEPANSATYKKFTGSDHFDAAQAHNQQASLDRNHYGGKNAQQHQDIAEQHLRLAEKEMQPEGVQKLPEAQDKALSGYTGHDQRGADHDILNNALEGKATGSKENTAAVLAQAAHLNQAIASSPIEQATTFYRGSDLPVVPEVGQDIATPRLLSVSTDPNIAEKFATEETWRKEAPKNPAIFTIHAPAGTPALNVNKHFFGIHAHEKEHILGSNQSFRVKSVRKEGNMHHVELEAYVKSPQRGVVKKGSETSAPSRKKLAHPKEAAKRLTSSAGFRVMPSAVEKCWQQAISLTKMGPLPGEFTTPEFMETQRNGRRRKKKGKDRRPFSLSGTIVKSISKPWQQLVYSIVYEPNTVDLHGDFMDAATIEKAAHESMRSGIYVNHEHGPERLGAHVVESYVAPCDMTIPSATGNAASIKKGTWVMGLKIEDAATWDRILDGTYQGFSLEGSGIAQTLAG